MEVSLKCLLVLTTLVFRALEPLEKTVIRPEEVRPAKFLSLVVSLLNLWFVSNANFSVILLRDAPDVTLDCFNDFLSKNILYYFDMFNKVHKTIIDLMELVTFKLCP